MLTAREIGEAVAHGMPGVEFLYYGDGSTSDPDDYVMLTPGHDPPTLSQVEAWHSEIQKAPSAADPTQAERVAAALATIENDASLADNVKTALANVVSALTESP